jgi:hypothetical protein
MSGDELACALACLLCCAPCPDPPRDPGVGERRDERVKALEQRVALLEGLLIGQRQVMMYGPPPMNNAQLACIKLPPSSVPSDEKSE